MPDNVLGNYNPEFFANEALDQLYKQLGMAGRVHRGIEVDRNTNGRSRGDVVNLRRPGLFTAQTHVPGAGSTGQALNGQNVQITLDSHKEVKFSITDRELAYTSQRIIDEHIKPAAFALGDQIDQDLFALGARVGAKTALTGTINATYITKPRKVLRDQGLAANGDIHYAIDTSLEAEFLNLEIFNNANTTGQGNNVGSLMMGSLGVRFGCEVFATQNAGVLPSVLASTATASGAAGDRAGTVTGDVAVNASTMTFGGLTNTQTLSVGDTFVVAGDPTTYILTSGGTISGSALTASFYPALRKSAADTTVVTFTLLTATEEAANIRNLMFHKNAFGLCFAPLPTIGDGKGAMIATVVDEISGIALRARMWYEGGAATLNVALDTLYGVQVLDGRMANRVLRAATIAPL